MKLLLLPAIIILFLHACDIFNSQDKQQTDNPWIEATYNDFYVDDEVVELKVLALNYKDSLFTIGVKYRQPTEKWHYYVLFGDFATTEFSGVGEYPIARHGDIDKDKWENNWEYRLEFIQTGFYLTQLDGDVRLGSHIADGDYGSVLRITHYDPENNYLEGHFDALMVPDSIVGYKNQDGIPFAGKNSVLPDTFRFQSEFRSNIVEHIRAGH